MNLSRPKTKFLSTLFAPAALAVLVFGLVPMNTREAEAAGPVNDRLKVTLQPSTPVIDSDLRVTVAVADSAVTYWNSTYGGQQVPLQFIVTNPDGQTQTLSIQRTLNSASTPTEVVFKADAAYNFTKLGSYKLRVTTASGDMNAEVSFAARAQDRTIQPSEISMSIAQGGGGLPLYKYAVAGKPNLTINLKIVLASPGMIQDGDELDFSLANDPTIKGVYLGATDKTDVSEFCKPKLPGLWPSGKAYMTCSYVLNNSYARQGFVTMTRLTKGVEIDYPVTLTFDDLKKLGLQTENLPATGGPQKDIYFDPVINLTQFLGYVADLSLENVHFNARIVPFNTEAEKQSAPENKLWSQGLAPSAGGGITNAAGLSSGSGQDTFGGAILSVVNIILGIIIAIVRWIVWFLGTLIFVPLLETTLSIDASQLTQPIAFGWQYVRDVVNMFFILGLIVIGFGTILKIESYNYKKLLVNLIMMALLVNFSLVIGRIIIQMADAAQFAFLPEKVDVVVGGRPDGVSGVKYLFDALVNRQLSSIVQGIKGFSGTTAGALATTFSLLFQFILELMVIITFGALAVFMLIRTVALWILLILSPVAYAFAIIPATADYAKRWWKAFIKYALFAPIIAFFLRLTLELYNRGLAIIPSNTSFATGALQNPGNLTSYINSLGQGTGEIAFGDTLQLIMIYVIILAFLWAGMMVTKEMGIYGAEAITGLAEKGIKAPFALAGKGIKMGAGAAIGYGQEKLLEKYGVDTRIGKWVEGWKQSREKNREAREAKGAAKALDRKSALASPATFFQRYWSPEGIKRVVQGGEKKGRGLLAEAEAMKKTAILPDNQQTRQAKNLREKAKKTEEEATALEAEAAATPGLAAVDKRTKANDLRSEAQSLREKAKQVEKPLEDKRKEILRQAREKEAMGKKLIAPDDYLTQQKIRSAIDEEMKTIHTNNWHELVDLFNSADREGKPLRAAAIMQHLTKTYNENELANSSTYTRKLEAWESADGKEHQEGENFEYSTPGMENFRKLIMEEKFKLGKEASMMIMSDVSDIAEDTKHFEIMRMYVSENGKLRLKRPDEREPEVSAELDKMSTGRVLSEGNRLVGSREVPDKDYDIYGTRKTYIEPHLVAYYLKNYPAVRFLLNRGQMNPSQAKAAAENREMIMAAAKLLDDDEEVEKIIGVSDILQRKGLKDTRRQQYIEIMHQLINYGATKGPGATGKSRIEEVQEMFQQLQGQQRRRAV